MTLLTTLLISLSAAPQAEALSLVPARLEPEPLLFDRPSGGELWAMGRTYKASFDEDGATYIPFLGSHAPRNYPVRFRVESVSVGGHELSFDRRVEALREGSTVRFERGSFVEIYELGPDSMEQMFRFDHPPGGGGDLIVRLAIETELQGSERGAGFGFMNELGGVSYGGAFALGTAGLREEVPAQLEDGTLELRLPAATIARAGFPLLLDPIISTFSINTAPFDDSSPDCAMSQASGDWCVVWQHKFSMTDYDVYSVMLSPDGVQIPGTGMFLDNSQLSWRRPRIAYDRYSDKFGIVAEALQAPHRNIVVRTRDRTTAGADTFVSDDPYPGDAITPDIAGNPHFEPGGSFCVVWTQTTSPPQVHWRMVNTSGIPWTPGRVLSPDAAAQGHPSISRSAGADPMISQYWMVAWESERFPGNHDIYTMKIEADGTSVAAPIAVHLSNLADLRNPSVSSILDGATFSRRFLVAYEYDTGLVQHILAKTGTPALSGWDGPFNLTLLQGLPAGVQHSSPSVDSDGSTFTVAYVQREGDTDYDPHVATFSRTDGGLVLTDDTPLADTAFVALEPMVASARSSGGSPQDLLAVWTQVSPATFTGDIFGAAYRTPGPGENYCTGELNSVGRRASISARGSISLYHNSMVLQVDSAPPNKPGIFFMGTAPVDVPFGEGRRCAGGPVGRIAPIVVTNGAGQVELPLDFGHPFGSLLTPGSADAYYQFWYRDPQGGPAGFNLSNGLHVLHTF